MKTRVRNHIVAIKIANLLDWLGFETSVPGGDTIEFDFGADDNTTHYAAMTQADRVIKEIDALYSLTKKS